MSIQSDARRAERDERVLYVRGLLLARLFRDDVVRLACAKYAVTRETARGYVRAARAEIAAGTGLSRRQHRHAALEYFSTVARASLLPPRARGRKPVPVPGVPDGFTATVREGLDAQLAVVKLLGLALTPDAEMDALKATLRGLIAALEPHAAALKPPGDAGEPPAPAIIGFAGGHDSVPS